MRARQYGPQATILVVSRLGGFPADMRCGVASSTWDIAATNVSKSAVIEILVLADA